MGRGIFQSRGAVAVLALAAAAVGGGFVGAGIQAGKEQTVTRTIPVFVSSGNAAVADRVSFEAGFSPVVQRVVPAVARVSSSRVVNVPGRPLPFFLEPFFGEPGPQRELEESLGSGVIISPDGYLLTNNHVIDGATDIKVTLSNRREYTAQVVGRDPQTDIAVLRVNAKDLPVLPLGDSSRIRSGDFVLAVGNPYGLSHTVTMGIVSATGRQSLDIEHYEDFIQTDAAINPGNSGGALVDVRGSLIGINTAILAGGKNGGNQGIGFAIPINMAREVMDEILKYGKVSRGYMGATVQDVTSGIAKAFGLTQVSGALVSDVTPGGPAARAGIQRGDIIVAMNGKPVTDAAQLRLEAAMTKPGTTVQLTVFRNGSKREVPVTLGQLSSKPETQTSKAAPAPTSALQGINVQELTSAIAGALHLPSGTKGVVITRVDPGSPAGLAGLGRGDVIQEVNRKPVTNTAEFERAVREAGNGPVLLLVNHGGVTIYVDLQP